jgi:hypothetical protein
MIARLALKALNRDMRFGAERESAVRVWRATSLQEADAHSDLR